MKLHRNNLHEIPALRPICVAWQRVKTAILPPPPKPPPKRPPDGIRFPPVPLPTIQRIRGRVPDSVVFRRPAPGETPVFSHSGKIGDIVFSLPFCRAVAAAIGRTAFSFHLKTGTVMEKLRPGGIVIPAPLLDETGARLLKPLLERQSFVESVTVSDAVPDGAIDLDPFRIQTGIPLWGNSLAHYYAPLAPWLVDVPDLSKPWLFGGRKIDLGGKKTALFTTERFRRPGFSFSFLEPFRDEILFLGTDAEHIAFEKANFPVFHRKISDFADALDVLSSVRLVIGNQTGFFAMAEALKMPRLMLVSDRDPNVVPCGGAYQFLHETESAKATFLAFRERFCL